MTLFHRPYGGRLPVLLKHTIAFVQVKQCDKIANYPPTPVPGNSGSKEEKPNNVHFIWGKRHFDTCIRQRVFMPTDSSVAAHATVMPLRAVSDFV